MNWILTFVLCSISAALGFVLCALFVAGKEADRELEHRCEGTSDE